MKERGSTLYSFRFTSFGDSVPIYTLLYAGNVPTAKKSPINIINVL